MLSYEDLKKVIEDLEIENARICVERDQLKKVVVDLEIENETLKSISLKQQNNDSSGSINNKSIEVKSSFKQQQHDINNVANNNNDAKSCATSSISTIFEFYEVNADILSLTSAAGR